MMSLYQSYVKKSDVPLQNRLEKVVDAIRPIDWAGVICELGGVGLSLRRIAEIVDVSPPTIQGWIDGSIPNYEAGNKLLEAHAEATGRVAPIKITAILPYQ